MININGPDICKAERGTSVRAVILTRLGGGGVSRCSIGGVCEWEVRTVQIIMYSESSSAGLHCRICGQGRVSRSARRYRQGHGWLTGGGMGGSMGGRYGGWQGVWHRMVAGDGTIGCGVAVLEGLLQLWGCERARVGAGGAALCTLARLASLDVLRPP